MKIPLIVAAMLLIGGCGVATQRQEIQPVLPQPVTVKDTVTLTVVDSTALRNFYRREKTLNDQLGTTMALLRDYVAQENRLNEHIQLLRDSMEQLIQLQHHAGEQQQLRVVAEEVADEQIATKYQDSTTALLLAKAAWLSVQPRKTYSIGAEDNVHDVEVANACRFENYLFIALASQGEITSALLNGKEPIISTGRVFVYSYPATPRVFIEALIGNRRYAIRTSLKKLTQ